MGLDRLFWSQQKVLLTGHTGFKGAWMRLWLQELGAEVVGLALPPQSQPNLDALLPQASVSVLADIRQRDRLADVFQETAPSLVIHMAAQPLVRESYRQPYETFEVNVMGTLNILEACRAYGKAKGLLIVTTDKCYRNQEDGQAFREEAPLGGHDPYSASKACAELASLAYAASFGQDMPPLATARAGNVIGGGDWSSERLVPDVMRAVYQHTPLLLRFPQAQRPWQLVLEPLYGYLLLLQALAQNPTHAGPWNFGPSPSATHSVGELVNCLVQKPIQAIQWAAPTPEFYEAQVLQLDSTKALQALGWHTRLDIEHTAAWTREWYARHAAGDNMHRFSQEQIRNYEQLWS